MPTGHDRDEIAQESLEQEATFILEESRMVLPGIQALFGFQLIAVFNQGFAEKLAPSEQIVHLLAFALVAVATALIITPAAYHRQAEREQVSEYFVRLASRLLTIALLFLMAGTSLDAFLVARIVTGAAGPSVAIAAALGLVFFGLWFVFPRLGPRLRRVPRHKPTRPATG
jgi:uncharacterized membrane-anchored protein